MLLFVGFLVLLLITLTTNLFFILLVSLDHRLHTPMYFFLCNVSLLDILIAISITPKLLAVFTGYNKINFSSCFVQLYFIISFGGTENFLFAAMAYDRYIAVVKPLHYNVIINTKKCFLILAVTWILGFLVPAANTILASFLPYCASNKIMHCYCDYPAVVSLSCAEVTTQEDGLFGLALIVNYVPLIYVLWSYIKILLSVLRLNTRESRTKAFSMCSSHMVLVSICYVFGFIVYAEFKMEGFSYERRIFVGSLTYLLLPMVNPLIYSLRNEKIKEAAKKHVNFFVICQKI
ncbi:olfactory receptor 10A6-like [Erpetoichthys calabaricus]|uniref:olfactory receptor 10A6-like n=1 Tax=Erpetoichthys calabaricus TaxID=27687 RepID=UPI0022348FB2|nr:olfactory receptor 10A6-like [Erpetoichthys calabaricus]